MSCDSNSKQSRLAAVKCGIFRVASATAYTGTAVQAGVARALQKGDDLTYRLDRRASSVTYTAVSAINEGERLGVGEWGKWALGAVVPEAGAALKLANKGIKLASAPTAMAGSVAGDLSRKELKSSVVQTTRFLGFFKKKTDARAWTSHLTPALNWLDLPTPGAYRNVTASSGVVIKVKGKTWHNGTTTIKTPDGKRTITHLQSLTLPQQHYYFNRPLGDRELAGIVAGKNRPAAMKGYVGQISPLEGLAGPWRKTKRRLFKARIFTPPPGADKTGDDASPPPPRLNLGVVSRLPRPRELQQIYKQGVNYARAAEAIISRELPEAEPLVREGKHAVRDVADRARSARDRLRRRNKNA